MIISLKKTWSWIKTHWYIPAIVVAIIVLTIIYRKVPTELFDMISKQKEIHKKEVEAIESIHAEEIEKRELALEQYNKTIKIVEEKYNSDKIQLSNKKRKEIKKLIEETNNDPKLLADKLSDLMGFEIIVSLKD